MKSKLSAAVAALSIIAAYAALAGSTAARADLITFALENVIFDDGTAATGTFTYDTITNIATPDITTVNGAISGATYLTQRVAALTVCCTNFVFISGNGLAFGVSGNPVSPTSPSLIIGGNEGVSVGGVFTSRLFDLTLNPTITPVPGPIVGAGLPGVLLAGGGLLAGGDGGKRSPELSANRSKKRMPGSYHPVPKFTAIGYVPETRVARRPSSVFTPNRTSSR